MRCAEAKSDGGAEGRTENWELKTENFKLAGGVRCNAILDQRRLIS